MKYFSHCVWWVLYFLRTLDLSSKVTAGPIYLLSNVYLTRLQQLFYNLETSYVQYRIERAKLIGILKYRYTKNVNKWIRLKNLKNYVLQIH